MEEDLYSEPLLPHGTLPKMKQIQNKSEVGGDSHYLEPGQTRAMTRHGLL